MDELTYDLICAAVRGEPDAQEHILIYYNDYINMLSTVEKTNEKGESVRYIDEDIKVQIQIKLLEATKKWRVIK